MQAAHGRSRYDRSPSVFRHRSLSSTQLTVLAAASVVAAELLDLAVGGFLTTHAEPNARNGVAPRLRNFRSAIRAMTEAGALRQSAFRAIDPILDRRIDLFLHRAVTCPTRRHFFSSEEKFSTHLENFSFLIVVDCL